MAIVNKYHQVPFKNDGNEHPLHALINTHNSYGFVVSEVVLDITHTTWHVFFQTVT